MADVKRTLIEAAIAVVIGLGLVILRGHIVRLHQYVVRKTSPVFPPTDGRIMRKVLLFVGILWVVLGLLSIVAQIGAE